MSIRTPTRFSRTPTWIRALFVAVTMVLIVVGLAILGDRVAANAQADRRQEKAIRVQGHQITTLAVVSCQGQQALTRYVEGLRDVLTGLDIADRPEIVRGIHLGDRLVAETAICDLAARRLGRPVTPP